jgi:RHS repeat-associated protein
VVNVGVIDSVGSGFVAVGYNSAAGAMVGFGVAVAGEDLYVSATVPVAADGTVSFTATGAVDVTVDVIGVFVRPVDTWTYGYRSDGLRSSKQEAGSAPVEFSWDSSGGLPLLLAQHHGTATSYLVYGPGGTVIYQVRQDGSVLNLHHDHLGSTRLVTAGSNGSTYGTLTYDAYGRTTSDTTPWFLERPLLGYTGQYRDTETGLIHLRARHYHPSTGQFLTRDPLVSVTQDPYSYAANDPANMVDPLGLAPWDALGDAWDATGGKAVSAVSSVGKQDGANFAGGVLNTITFDNEQRINRALVQRGKVRRDSGFYTAGEITGIAVDIKAGSKVVFSASSRFPRFANWLSQTKYVGSRSNLFGRGYRGTRGILNQGPARLGWGWNGSREVFRMGFGTPGKWTHCHWDLL